MVDDGWMEERNGEEGASPRRMDDGWMDGRMEEGQGGKGKGGKGSKQGRKTWRKE